MKKDWKRGKKILSLLLAIVYSFAFSQWPTKVEDELIVGRGYSPQAVSDGYGGAIIVWQGKDIYAQRVNRYGYKCWPEPIHIKGLMDDETIADHKIVTDGKGGMYVLFQDIKYWDYPFVQNRHLRLHHIDSSGTFLWGEGGILIATPSDTTQKCYNDPTGSCIYDGEGGVIVAWKDFRGLNPPAYTYGHVFIQKYNEIGQGLWESGGVQLTDSLTECEFPILCTDGNGGAYVYYGLYGGPFQKVDRNGNKKWGKNKILDVLIRNLHYDFLGGVYCTGIYYPNYPEGYPFCLRLDSTGASTWSQKVFLDTISSSILLHQIHSVSNLDSTLSVIIPKHRLFRITPGGEMIYNHNGIVVDSKIRIIHAMISDRNNSNIVLGIGDGVYASKFDKSGNAEWDNQPILISHKYQNVVGDVVINDDGSIIIAMELNYNYITVKKITKDGKIGGDESRVIESYNQFNPAHFRLFPNYPNPFNTSTVISYQLFRSANICLAIYSLCGREIIRLVNARQTRGYYQYSWNGFDKSGRQVSSGIYICLMQIDGFRKSFKIALIR